MKISEIIAKSCYENQDLYITAIYIFIVIFLIDIICMLVKENKKRSVVYKIKQIYERAGEDEEEISDELRESYLEQLEINYPLLKKELDDIYSKKRKQLSIIDILENNVYMSHSKVAFIKALINSFTALGLLGTFVGLIAGIYGLQQESVVTPLAAFNTIFKAMPNAFGTTIIGVIASIASSLGFSYHEREYKTKIAELAESIMVANNDTNPDYFYDNFTTFTGQKYTAALETIVNKFLDQMKEALTKDVKDYQDAIKDAMKNLTASEKEFTEAAGNLSETVNTINGYMEDTSKLNEEFKIKLEEFTGALNNFNDLFNDTYDNANETLGVIRDISDKNKDVNKSLLEHLGSELAQLKDSFEIIKEMTKNYNANIMKAPEMVVSSTAGLCSSIDEFTKKIDKSFKNFSDSLADIERSIKQQNSRSRSEE